MLHAMTWDASSCSRMQLWSAMFNMQHLSSVGCKWHVVGGSITAVSAQLSASACECLPHVCAGVSNFSELQYYEQVQAIARPVNASDPKLKLWKKFPNNPLISQAPQGGTLAQFRDPVSAWKQVTLASALPLLKNSSILDRLTRCMQNVCSQRCT